MVKRLLITKLNYTTMENLSIYEIIKILGKSKVIDILKSLSHSEKTLTELQFDVRAQISTTQRAIDALLSAGLIKRKEKKRNNRVVTVYQLTPLGWKVLRWLDALEDNLSSGLLTTTA